MTSPCQTNLPLACTERKKRPTRQSDFCFFCLSFFIEQFHVLRFTLQKRINSNIQGILQFTMERVTRFELATFSLATRRSTTELHPQFCPPAVAFSEGWKGKEIMSSRLQRATF